MDIVTDLTAEAVSYITLFQDILKSQPKSTVPNNLINNTEWKSLNVCNLLIDNLTPNQKEKIRDLVWHSPTKANTKDLARIYFKRTVLLLDWLSENILIGKKKIDLLLSAEGTSELILFKPPFFWREKIRHILYKESDKRLELVELLEYMPVQVILAITLKKEKDYTIRLYQFYIKKIFEKESETVVTFNDHDLLTREDKDKHAEFWKSEEAEFAQSYLKNDQELLKKLIKNGCSIPFETLFRDELIEISRARKARDKELNLASVSNDYKSETLASHSIKAEQVFDAVGEASEMKLMGLAFSGGGIRSATFNLGILQRLAALNALHKFDYISTVSGGGYIGTWFNSWIKRSGSFSKINDRLSPDKSGDPLADEVRPIRWLRMFSNYLSPNVGIMSPDAWTSGMTWVRNTMINQTVLLLTLLTILSCIYTIYSFWDWARESITQQSILCVSIWSSIILIIGSLIVAIPMRTFYSDEEKESHKLWLINLRKSIINFTRKFKLGTFIPNIILIWGGFSALIISTYFAAYNPNFIGNDKFWFIGLVFCAAFSGFIWVAVWGNYHKRWDLMKRGVGNVTPKEEKNDYAKDEIQESKKIFEKKVGWAIALSSLVASAVLVFLLIVFWSNTNFIYNLFIEHYSNSCKVFFVIGIPCILEIFSIAVIIRMALMGNLFPDYRREWWGRIGGLVHRFILFWIIISFASLIMPDLWEKYSKSNLEGFDWKSLTGWTGWAGFIGWGMKKAFEATDESESKKKSYIDILLKVVPFVFMVGVLLIGSWILDKIEGFNFFPNIKEDWGKFGCITISLLIITVLVSWRVGVNEFSLHHFYRNRLIRAFMGATRSREERIKTANAFTGFDAYDDILLSSMTVKDGYFGPLPLINATLNATVVSALDRQDRKGESFVFSPLYCGYDFSPTRSSTYNVDRIYEYGYRPTNKFSNKNGGPTMGTAMAISGAAVNPNWGYHSSSTMAFLLTLFNLRLGWWIGNPRLAKWKNPDPVFGLLYLMRDLIGKSDINMKYVCLSDGGHFDNTGLYELIRRRCQYILLGDAEQDNRGTCEGLANAIRRCRIDFGVDIDISIDDIIKGKSHIAKGAIKYPGDKKDIGTLIYIKTVVTGEEPADIREYALANPDFPQQSTGDQFFDEAQFESYRKLGYYSIKDISELHLP
ncbi:patatin-like phospholipase family protein [Flavobacterium sp. KACC 22763]|uniref:patatin-like phospholipase family protein n=1 Tax=Flavobacterium sp. KACC 22763 TaxID=3025668 RepID=UPI002365A7CC|nr:patatin-like phospholipase family protein [Flavobacterium sp. KACC 22763]WDF62282.1 patatin-like phospholipase family protein [Flavobacterium sp. KACC 22763]